MKVAGRKLGARVFSSLEGFQPETQGTAETTASVFDRCRGEHEASRKTTVCGTPDVYGAFVVANSCACFIAHEAADPSRVRRSARPLQGARTKAVSGAPAPFKQQGSPRTSATRCALFLANGGAPRPHFGRGGNGVSAARAVVNHRVATVVL